MTEVKNGHEGDDRSGAAPDLYTSENKWPRVGPNTFRPPQTEINKI